jgi:hypothetical protein
MGKSNVRFFVASQTRIESVGWFMVMLVWMVGCQSNPKPSPQAQGHENPPVPIAHSSVRNQTPVPSSGPSPWSGDPEIPEERDPLLGKAPEDIRAVPKYHRRSKAKKADAPPNAEVLREVPGAGSPLPPKGKVRIEILQGSHRLRPRKRSLAQLRSLAEHCYNGLLKAQPKAAGTLNFVLKVQASGNVKRVSLIQKQTFEKPFVRCVKALLMKHEFASITSATNVQEIRGKFHFQPLH